MTAVRAKRTAAQVVATHLQAFSSLLAHDADAAQLHMRDLQIIALLVSHDVPMSVSMVATMLGVSQPLISRTVEKMVQRGLIVRSAHPTDRRQVLLTASDAGRALDKRVRQHFVTAQECAEEDA